MRYIFLKKNTKKTTAQAFTRAAIFQTMKGNHPLTPPFYPHPSQCQALSCKKKQPRKLSPARLFIQKCKGTTPCALILPITLTLSSTFLQKKRRQGVRIALPPCHALKENHPSGFFSIDPAIHQVPRLPATSTVYRMKSAFVSCRCTRSTISCAVTALLYQCSGTRTPHRIP